MWNRIKNLFRSLFRSDKKLALDSVLPIGTNEPREHTMKFDRILNGEDKRQRKQKWSGILIHHTDIGGRKEISKNLWAQLNTNIANFLAKKDSSYVSAHYQIGRAGELTSIIDPDNYVAYHAGKSSFWNPESRKWESGCNEFFIGIELLGDGNLHYYSSEQYERLAELIKYLIDRFPTINPQCIVGHEVVSPGRKQDPGILFDWHRLYKLIFGGVSTDGH